MAFYQSKVLSGYSAFIAQAISFFMVIPIIGKVYGLDFLSSWITIISAIAISEIFVSRANITVTRYLANKEMLIGITSIPIRFYRLIKFFYLFLAIICTFVLIATFHYLDKKLSVNWDQDYLLISIFFISISTSSFFQYNSAILTGIGKIFIVNWIAVFLGVFTLTSLFVACQLELKLAYLLFIIGIWKLFAALLCWHAVNRLKIAKKGKLEKDEEKTLVSAYLNGLMTHISQIGGVHLGIIALSSIENPQVSSASQLAIRLVLGVSQVAQVPFNVSVTNFCNRLANKQYNQFMNLFSERVNFYTFLFFAGCLGIFILQNKSDIFNVGVIDPLFISLLVICFYYDRLNVFFATIPAYSNIIILVRRQLICFLTILMFLAVDIAQPVYIIGVIFGIRLILINFDSYTAAIEHLEFNCILKVRRLIMIALLNSISFLFLFHWV